MQSKNHHEEGAWTIQIWMLLENGTNNNIVYSVNLVEDACMVSNIGEG